MSERMELATARATEHRDELGLVEARNLADGPDASVVKLLRRDRSDAPEPFDRERVQKRQLAVRGHDEQTVRLRDSARHLREELRPRQADGDGEADPLADVAA